MVRRKKKTTVTASTCEGDSQKLPLVLKEKFGQLGFVKWTCAHCPVLIVDPMKMVLAKLITDGIYHAWAYKVHLYYTAVRDQVEDARNLTSNLPVLVYWFGTSYEFSIVQLSTVIEWKKGCALGYDKIPEFMLKRITDLVRSIPAVYSLIFDGLKQVKASLRMQPHERSLAILNKRNRNACVLNEWHALAMEDPPQMQSWKEQKTALEEQLPNSDMFGSIGFLPKKMGSSGKTYNHPVLVLGPFRAPPGPMRHEWFHKCSSGKMIMVYWFGSYTSGRAQQNVFTFQNREEFIPYNVGRSKRYDFVPAEIKKQYNDASLGSKRIGPVDMRVCAKWELEEALKRKPRDRWGGLEDFEEDLDDDFDYYWDCIDASRQAEEAKADASATSSKNHASDTAPNSASVGASTSMASKPKANGSSTAQHSRPNFPLQEEPPASVSDRTPSGSDEDIDYQIQNSLRNCAAFLRKGKRQIDRKRKKRKAEPSSPLRHELNTLASEPNERIVGLKRRKYESEKVVHDVIKAGPIRTRRVV